VRRIVFALRVLVLALAPLACGFLGGSPGPPASLAAVELGTGTTRYEPLMSEQELDLIMGPQGGYHFIVHARIRDLSPGDPQRPGRPEDPSTTFSVFAEDGHQMDFGYPPYRLGYEPLPPTQGDDGWYALPSGRILQVENEEIPAIYNTPVKLTVTVTDQLGRRASDEVWVVARRGAPADFDPDAGLGDRN
jgi:hypothetical protein